MQGPISEFNYTALVSDTQTIESKKVFAQTMKGVHSARINIKEYQFGKLADEDLGMDYRQFFYNDKGDVIKKLSFGSSGEIIMKEEYEYNKDGKILTSKFITIDNIIRENYEYDKSGKLLKYEYNNPRLPTKKYEVNEFDTKGRLVKTISYGLLGTPELISHYIYTDLASNNYNIKHVTRSDGKTLMTFYYNFNKTNNTITGLYGFYLEPNEVEKLLKNSKTGNAWELQSEFRSIWEYKDGKQTSYFKDEKIKPIHFDFGYILHDERILTERSTSFYEKINKKNYLVKTIEWQTRFLEPLKEIKDYKYFDENNKQIYPSLKQKAI